MLYVKELGLESETMPYKRRRMFRRGSKKRSFKRRRFARRMYRRNRPNPQVALPKSRLVKMRYSDSFLVSTPGVADLYFPCRWSCTNINAPDVDGVGVSHQALGRDQWAALFNSYCVVGARMRVQTVNCHTTNTAVMCGAMVHDDTSTAAASMTTLVEQGKSTWRVLQGVTNGNVAKYGLKFSTKKWFGLTNVKDNLALYGAPFASAPPKTANFLLWFGVMPSNTVAVTDLSVTIMIDYSVLLFEPTELPQS